MEAITMSWLIVNPSPPSSPSRPHSPRSTSSARSARVDVEDIRRSSRLEARRWTSLGPFRTLPCEILQHILSFLPVRALSQLAQVSSGWRLFLQDWVKLKSTACILAPVSHHPYQSDEFFDEYVELGLLCRRVLFDRPMPERAHAFWKVLLQIEAACITRCDRYEPTFLGASNFFRAAVALNCCRTMGEKFETLWQIVKDLIDVDASLLEGVAGCQPERETDLRLAVRVLYLTHASPPRHARASLPDRGMLLRSLLWKLPARQQARLLFVLYGPRSGNAIEWAKPCDAGFTTLTQMVHIVSELGAAIESASRNSTPTFIFNLIYQLLRTPERWLPRYEVMLLLTMGTRAVGAFLAGYAPRLSPQNSRFIATRLAQMISLSQLYQVKLTSGTNVTGPVLTAATIDMLDVLIYFYRYVPAESCPVNLLNNVTTQAFMLAFNVGGTEFSSKVMDAVGPLMDYFQGMP